MYSQKNYPQKLGTCSCTIKSDGCFLTSYCNLLHEFGTEITPPEFNKIAFPKGGCLANASYWAKLYNLSYEKVFKDPGTLCIIETNFYANKGVPQHFCLFKKGMRVDPLDLDPNWELNTYPVVSYRVFKTMQETPKPMQNYLNGIDISHYQGIIDWDKVKTDFVICKCTEGTNYLDPTFIHNKQACEDRGITFGCYHFSRGGNAVSEADWFLNHADGFLVLDWEIEHADPVEWCKKFIDRVYEKTQKSVILYTNEARALKYDFGDYPMWIAKYGTNDGTMQKPPTKEWLIWQYTSKGKVDGIKGDVDLNIAKIDPVSEAETENSIDVQVEHENATTGQIEAKNDMPGEVIQIHEAEKPTPTVELEFIDILINLLKTIWNKSRSFFNAKK
ncbi:MAG TPA: hypothetical protein DGG95_02520 [Cytophagales bacterium]|nr:hypothetical protein [Cytophagales bacterium]